jgi:hypothetical protein
LQAEAAMRVLAVSILTLSLATSALAQTPSPATLVIKGEAGQTVTLTASDLDALPQAGVTLSHDGHSFTLTGARLDAVLAKVDAPLGKALRGPARADVVLIKASDGYRVTLSLGEIDPGVRPEAVIGPVVLAAQKGGAPLGKDGPFRLGVGGDLRPARSARNVVEIDVLRVP